MKEFPEECLAVTGAGKSKLFCKACREELSLKKNINYGLSRVIREAQARQEIASFPGSSPWVDEKEPGTHCLRMLSSPRISGNLEIFRKICSVTLTSARYADFSRIKDGCH